MSTKALRRTAIEAASHTLHEASGCEDIRRYAGGVCPTCYENVTPVVDETLDLTGWVETSTTYSKMCGGKQAYKNRSKALSSAAHLSHLGPQRAYRCPYCSKYHLTSKRAFA